MIYFSDLHLRPTADGPDRGRHRVVVGGRRGIGQAARLGLPEEQLDRLVPRPHRGRAPEAVEGVEAVPPKPDPGRPRIRSKARQKLRFRRTQARN